MNDFQKPRNGSAKVSIIVENYKYLLIKSIARHKKVCVTVLLRPLIDKFLEDNIKDIKSKE